MIQLRHFLSVLGMFSAASLLPAATPLTHLVGENTPFVISVNDFPSALKHWDQSPWAKTWNDEQMKAYLAPLRQQMKIDEWDEQAKAETGFTVTELKQMVTGGILVALKNVDFASDPSLADEPAVLIAMEFGANASKIEKILIDASSKGGQAPAQTEDFAGVTLHIGKPDAGKERGGTIWAMTDGVLFVSPSKTTIQEAIDSLKKGGVSSPLGQSEKFQRIAQKAGPAHLTCLIDVSALYPSLQKLAESKRGEANPMFDPTLLLPALGIDAIQEIFVTVQLNESHSEANMGLVYNEARGLLKLLAYKEGPVAQLPFASNRWVSATFAKLSLKDVYAGLEEIVGNVSPFAAQMVQQRIGHVNQMAKIDIKRDIIGSLGDDMAFAYVARPGATEDAPPAIDELDRIMVVSLSNGEAFVGALEALKGLAGPQVDQLFQKRDFLGSTIFTISPPNGQVLSYAVTKNHFLLGIGSAAPVESALQMMNAGKGNFWDQADVKRALAESPSHASSFQFENTRFLISSVMQTFETVGNTMAAGNKNRRKKGKTAPDDDEADAEVTQWFDQSAKPDPGRIAQYWSYSSGYVYRDSQGLFAKSKIIHPK